MSAEPPTAAWVQGKRWEDLIEAATSATEADDDRDLTPVSFPSVDCFQNMKIFFVVEGSIGSLFLQVTPWIDFGPTQDFAC